MTIAAHERAASFRDCHSALERPGVASCRFVLVTAFQAHGPVWGGAFCLSAIGNQRAKAGVRAINPEAVAKVKAALLAMGQLPGIIHILSIPLCSGDVRKGRTTLSGPIHFGRALVSVGSSADGNLSP